MRVAKFIGIAAVLASSCGSPQSTSQSTSKPSSGAELRSSPELRSSGSTQQDPAVINAAAAIPKPPPPPSGWIINLTVVSAEVAGRMPNDEDWDAKGARAPSGVAAPIADYLRQHPELRDTAPQLGVPVEAQQLAAIAAKSPAADPMVIVELDGRIYRSPTRPRQFNPVWDFPISFLYGERGDRAGVKQGATAQIYVVDYDGPNSYDIIGSTLISVDELLSKPIHQLGPFGSVKRLVLRVARADLPPDTAAPMASRLAVAGAAAWTDTGVALVAGQRVVIEAADEVCSKGGSLEHCSGPEGQRKSSSYNLPGFSTVGHGALVGSLGDTRFAVRRHLSFVAPSSGTLRLGINDKDVRDNRGSYAVRVEVAPVPN